MINWCLLNSRRPEVGDFEKIIAVTIAVTIERAV
jgi:hypothetical protein